MDIALLETAGMLVIMLIVLGIPALAIAARIASKPIIEALRTMRETQALPPNDVRVAQLEAEVRRLSTEVERLSEAESFTRQLGEGSSQFPQ